MISNPDLILYACIAKGPTILTEFISSKEPGIEDIGKNCIEKTPPNHSTFSHTVRKKTYTFLIDDPFAYFVIFQENLEKSESLWFLNRVKNAFEEFTGSNFVKDFDELTYNCFQGDFLPVFSDILSLDAELADSLMEIPKDIRNPSLDSTKGKRSVVRPLLSKPTKLMMKKKKRPPIGGCAGCVTDGGEGNLVCNSNNNKINHVGENGNSLMNREFSVSMHKNGGSGFYLVEGRQKAKQIWRKQVWIVLILDLVICAALFGIWLWVCRGFKCIDG